jgi:hypothetical protein
MPVEEILGVIADLADVAEIVDWVYRGVFRRLFHGTGRLIARIFTFNRTPIRPNKRSRRIDQPLTPTKGDSFAVFLGFVFWAIFVSFFIYWIWFA